MQWKLSRSTDTRCQSHNLIIEWQVAQFSGIIGLKCKKIDFTFLDTFLPKTKGQMRPSSLSKVTSGSQYGFIQPVSLPSDSRCLSAF